MVRTFFVLGAVLGGLAVTAGAFGAHGLEGRVPEDRLQTFELAARFQMYHALALLAAAWAAAQWPAGTASAAGWFFVAGVAIFSGTLYVIGLGGPRWFGAITPIGGTALIIGWALLAWAAFKGATHA